MIVAPIFESSIAVSFPIPVFAPVINTIYPFKSFLIVFNLPLNIGLMK